MKFTNEGNRFIIETEKGDSTTEIRFIERSFWSLLDLLEMIKEK